VRCGRFRVGQALTAKRGAEGLCLWQPRAPVFSSFERPGRDPRTWQFDTAISLAVAIRDDEVLSSIQDGPLAKRSQVWRWPIDGARLELVRNGLPKWLDGKIDTARIAASDGRAAIADGGGNLWLSSAGSRQWKRIATDVPYGPGVLIV
jgi:hypothetical protein